ncbi:hypothetical protein [Corynebacterium sp. 13CS0277]|uniref:hypothetical protein n=1 Tax=Corynebacterium sp. 13CS0277 TaxID=2071994 RepID=UPI0011B2524C|nr:hypothetical protein [Corynebacterium sp. 13CS0277]
MSVPSPQVTAVAPVTLATPAATPTAAGGAASTRPLVHAQAPPLRDCDPAAPPRITPTTTWE